MCSVMPAAKANARQNSSASWGSKVPIHSDDGVDLVDEERAARQVERDLHQRLVEGHERRREPPHAGLVAEGLLERGAEHDADVLHGVVEVDVEVARRDDPQVEAAVLPELLEHVVEERDAGRRRRAARAVDDERRARSWSPWWSRCCSRAAVVAFVIVDHLRQDRRASAARNASFSAGVPMVTRRQSSSAWPAREVAHEHPLLDQPLPERVAVAGGAEQQEVRARREHGDAVDVGERRGDPLPLRDQRRTRSSISAPSSSASRCPRSGWPTTRWYGSTTFSSSATTHGGATAKPSRSAAIDHTFEYVRTTTSGRSSRRARARSTARTRRRPRRRRRDRRRRRRAGASTVVAGSTVPVGLFGLHTNTIVGACRPISVAARRRDRWRSRRDAPPPRPRCR